MTNERWQLAYSIYEAAASLTESERKEYVEASAPDAEIAAKVLALLDEMESTADSDGFTETIDSGPPLIASETCRTAPRLAALSSPVLSARGEWGKCMRLTTPIWIAQSR